MLALMSRFMAKLIRDMDRAINDQIVEFAMRVPSILDLQSLAHEQ